MSLTCLMKPLCDKVTCYKVTFQMQPLPLQSQKVMVYVMLSFIIVVYWCYSKAEPRLVVLVKMAHLEATWHFLKPEKEILLQIKIF